MILQVLSILHRNAALFYCMLDSDWPGHFLWAVSRPLDKRSAFKAYWREDESNNVRFIETIMGEDGPIVKSLYCLGV